MLTKMESIGLKYEIGNGQMGFLQSHEDQLLKAGLRYKRLYYVDLYTVVPYGKVIALDTSLACLVSSFGELGFDVLAKPVYLSVLLNVSKPLLPAPVAQPIFDLRN